MTTALNSGQPSSYSDGVTNEPSNLTPQQKTWIAIAKKIEPKVTQAVTLSICHAMRDEALSFAEENFESAQEKTIVKTFLFDKRVSKLVPFQIRVEDFVKKHIPENLENNKEQLNSLEKFCFKLITGKVKEHLNYINDSTVEKSIPGESFCEVHINLPTVSKVDIAAMLLVPLLFGMEKIDSSLAFKIIESFSIPASKRLVLEVNNAIRQIQQRNQVQK